MNDSDIRSMIIEKLYEASSTDKPFSEQDFTRITKNDVDALVYLSEVEDTCTHAVIFFHGNYGNVTWYTEQLKQLAKKYPNSDIWTFDYPGFGRSKGQPCTKTLIQKAFDFLKTIETRYRSWDWIAESIGGGVSIGIIYNLDNSFMKLAYLPRSITLINTFSSLGSRANETSPLGRISVQKFGFEMNTKKWITSCKKSLGSAMPTIKICRAVNDEELIPKHAEKLAEAADVCVIELVGNHRNYTFP